MKKSILVLFAILVLILAVSCSESDFFGKIEIDTSKITIPENTTSVQLAFTTDPNQIITSAGYPLSVKDVKKGHVRVEMPAGYYYKMELVFIGSTGAPNFYQLVEKVRDTDMLAEGAVIVVDKGETTYCLADRPVD